MEKSFYTCEEIARHMGIKVSTIRAYCKRGKLPSIKIGRSYHISAREFEEWCQDMKEVPRDTEIKRYLKKVKESEAKYKNFINQNLDGIVMTDFKGVIILANPSFCRMLNYREDELLGTNFTQYVHPDQRAQAVEDLMHQVAGKTSHGPKATWLLRKGGKTVYAEISESPTWDAGQIVGIQKIVRDITARRTLEQELESILELLPSALVINDLKGKVYRTNSRVEEVTGYTGEELRKMKSVNSLYWNPEQREKVISILKEKGEFYGLEITGRLKGDIKLPVEMHAKVIDIGGEQYVLSLVQDITERKKMQDDLKKAKSLLEATLNTLSFGVSHLDANLQIVFANAWLRRNIPCIAMGKNCSMPFSSEKECCPGCPSHKSLKSGKPEKADISLKSREGKSLEFRVRAYPLKDDEGNVINIVETFVDLSENQKLLKYLEP